MIRLLLLFILIFVSCSKISDLSNYYYEKNQLKLSEKQFKENKYKEFNDSQKKYILLMEHIFPEHTEVLFVDKKGGVYVKIGNNYFLIIRNKYFPRTYIVYPLSYYNYKNKRK